MKRFIAFTILSVAILSGCIKSGDKASVNDLYIGGISNNRLMLEGAEGSTKTFSIKANYDWTIIDYDGFTCAPSYGPKTKEGEVIEVTATAL